MTVPERTNQPSQRWWWLTAAALLSVGLLLMAVMSAALSPVKPISDRPLVPFVACWLLSWCGFAIACRLVCRDAARPRLWLILGLALVARGIFLPTSLIQSDDCYRYILDGQSMLSGLNPFQYSPQQIAVDPPQDLLGDQPERARQAILLVNNAHVATIYPPLAQIGFALGAWLTPWEVLGQRIVFLTCDLATLIMLLWLLRRLALPPAWIVIYAWNPLVIKEISNTAHLDSLVSACLVMLCGILIVGRQMLDRAGLGAHLAWGFFAGLSFGAAILAKLYPLLLLPVCLVWLLRSRHALCSIPAFLFSATFYVVLAYATFLEVGFDQVSAGLRTYSEHWINNAGLFELIQLCFESARTVAWLGVAGVVLIAAGLLLRGPLDAAALIRALQVSLLGWFLLMPACFPWYLVSLLAISVLRPRSWAVVLSGALGLYYLVQWLGAQDGLEHWQRLVQYLQHGIIWAWLMGGTIKYVQDIRRRSHS